MAWELLPTENLKTILDIYEGVFEDKMTLEDYQNRTAGYKIHLFIVQRSEEPPAGFVILRGKADTVEMWQAGILPAFRKAGGGTCLVTQSELKMTELGYSRMKVYTFNYWNIMLSMLTRRGYRIMGAQLSDRRNDLKLELVRELRYRKELRYALTNKCNFRCIFCHNEGLGHGKELHLPVEKVCSILEEAVQLGYTDITFTGGEPLLKKNRVKSLIKHLGTLKEPPDLTMVTNASLLKDEIIDSFVAYPGKCKINLSLHATDEKTFMDVTRMSKKGVFQNVQNNVYKASQAGVVVKVNHVVLQNINHTKIDRAVELSHSLGASTIKFLELLVLPENPNDYQMYYELSAIQKQIDKIGINAKRLNPRQLVYQFKKDPSFTIELQKCTCAIGCSQCREVRDKTFSSDMRYHPCFIRSKQSYLIEEPQNLNKILRKGDRIINGYAVKYKGLSPTLIQKDRIVPGKKEFFFHVDNFEEFRTFLQEIKFSQVGRTGFHLEYFWPKAESESWRCFKHVLKFGWDHHNQSKVDMIVTDHEYISHPGIGLETKTRFLDKSGPMTFETAETARRFLNRIEFKKYMEFEWEIETWQKDDLNYNLSLSGNCSTIKVEGSLDNINESINILNKYKGEVNPIMEPLEAFIYNYSKF